jgi:hypothetical protein
VPLRPKLLNPPVLAIRFIDSINPFADRLTVVCGYTPSLSARLPQRCLPARSLYQFKLNLKFELHRPGGTDLIGKSPRTHKHLFHFHQLIGIR